MKRLALCIVTLAMLASACSSGSEGKSSENAFACDGNANAFSKQMETYSNSDGFLVDVTQEGGALTAVSVSIPAITFNGEAAPGTLPTGPCQHIYRFKYLNVEHRGVDAPFKYVEIDWNTEGKPRGPNGSFLSSHFDFHFYLQPQAWIEKHLTCVSSNGKTCDASLSDYDQIRRFQSLPDADKVPDLYRADVGSAIPAMGLHLLDYTIDYTVDTVDHYPTIIYGTFDGEIIFLEASVTLQTLQDAVSAPSQQVSFAVRQPSQKPSSTWPTSFDVIHDANTGGFTAKFSGWQSR